MEAQAALEQAVANLLKSGLGYADADCQRCHDGQPPPRAGECFLAVWSPDDRESVSRTCLAERHRVFVTVTLRAARVPFDRLLTVRDELARRCDQVRALVHKDSHDQRFVRAAEVLADFSNTTAGKPNGWAEGLAYEGRGAVEEKGGEWFHAKASDNVAGLVQTLRFGKAFRVQSISVAT